jgi:outer membrane protein assembly factor BamB
MAITAGFRSRRLAAVATLLSVLALAAPASAATAPAASAGWLDGDADWQHDSYNRHETQLSVRNVGSLHGGLTVSAASRRQLTMPTVAGGTLYFGSYWAPGQARTSVEAHDATTGRLQWRRTAPEPFPATARQPKYLNGRVYVTSGGGDSVGSISDRTAALDAKTGGRLWQVSGVADVVGYGQLFVRDYHCDGGGCWQFSLTAYDAGTGRVTWSRMINPDPPSYTGGGFSGGVLNAGTLYFGEDDADGHFWLRAVDARTGEPRWSTPTSAVPTAAAVDAATGAVLVAESNKVRAVVGATGRVRWVRAGLDLIGSTEFYLPGGTASGAVAVGQGALFALCGVNPGTELCATRLSDGRTITTFRPPTCSATSNLWSALALANGVLYATSSGCGVVAIDTAARRVIGTVAPGKGLLRPEVADGRLYAGTHRAVTAWKL